MGRKIAIGCGGAVVAVMLLVAGLVLGYAIGARQAPDDAPMPEWALPFAPGESWAAGAPHRDGEKAPPPVNALDFAPLSGPGRVLTIAAGKVFRIECDNGFYLGVDHGSGWRSTYYHMVNQQAGLDGHEVPVGTYLGEVGTELPCGGRADGPHVHISIYHGDRPVSVDGVRFGGYRAFGTGRDYAGFWLDASGSRVIDTEHQLRCCLRSDAQLPTASPS